MVRSSQNQYTSCVLSSTQSKSRHAGWLSKKEKMKQSPLTQKHGGYLLTIVFDDVRFGRDIIGVACVFFFAFFCRRRTFDAHLLSFSSPSFFLNLFVQNRQITSLIQSCFDPGE